MFRFKRVVYLFGAPQLEKFRPDKISETFIFQSKVEVSFFITGTADV